MYFIYDRFQLRDEIAFDTYAEAFEKKERPMKSSLV